MPVFEIQSDRGTFQVEAPDQMTAVKALETMPEPETTLAGSARALGAGLGEGGVMLAGLPGDLADAASRGFDYVTGKNTNETIGPFAKKIGSESIKKNVTGEFYKPEDTVGKYLKTIGEFGAAAALGPGGIARRVATNVIAPGAASEAAGQLTEGTSAEPYARIAGALGGAVGAARLAQTAAPAARAAAPVPTREELANAVRAGYNHPAVTSLEIAPQSTARLAGNIRTGLDRGAIGGNPIPEFMAPNTYRALGILERPAGQTSRVAEIDGVRRTLGDIAGEVSAAGRPTSDALAAMRAQRSIDAYLLRIPRADVVAGDARVASQILRNARANAAAGFRSDRVTQAIERATNTAAATHSGGNLQNEVQKQLRTMLNNPRRNLRGWNDEEIAALRHVARGGAASGLFRRVGKLLGGGGGLGQLASGGAGGAMFGWPGMVALPAIGMAANRLGARATVRGANNVDELLRSRSALYGPANQAAYQAAMPQGGILGQLPPGDILALQTILSARPQLANQ